MYVLVGWMFWREVFGGELAYGGREGKGDLRAREEHGGVWSLGFRLRGIFNECGHFHSGKMQICL